MAVRSVLRASRPLSPRKIPGTHFCQRLSRYQGHSAAGKLNQLIYLAPTQRLLAICALPNNLNVRFVKICSSAGFNKSLVNNKPFVISSVRNHLLWFVSPFPCQAVRSRQRIEWPPLWALKPITASSNGNGQLFSLNSVIISLEPIYFVNQHTTVLINSQNYPLQALVESPVAWDTFALNSVGKIMFHYWILHVR
jgi:hypothetical protein